MNQCEACGWETERQARRCDVCYAPMTPSVVEAKPLREPRGPEPPKRRARRSRS